MGLRSFLDSLTRSPNPIIDYRVDASPLMLRGDYAEGRELLQARTASWAAWGQDSDAMRDAARKSVTVFACATLLGDAVAEAQLTVQQRVDGAWEEAITRPAQALMTLINRPNPHMEDAEFLSLIVLQQAIMGYAVIEKVRSGAGLPVELWPLRADWLSKTDKDSSQYQYKVPGKPQRNIPDDDLIWLPYRHDDKLERRGISPVTIAAREIGIDSELTNWLKAFLDAGGIPMYVMTTGESIHDEAQVQLIQEQWRQKYGGSKAYGQIPVMHGGWDIKSVGGDVNQLAWPDLRGLTELKICSAFRVPPGLIGAKDALHSGSLTTTEMDGDMSALQRHGAEPLRLRIAAGMGRSLLPEFGLPHETHRMVFDTSMVLALQENTDELHTRIRADLGASLIMLDEARQAIGLEPLPSNAGQVFAVPFSTMFVSAAALGGFEELPAAITASRVPAVPALSAGNSSQPVERQYIWSKATSAADIERRATVSRRTRADREKLARIGTRHIGRFLKEQGERIASNVTKSDPTIELKDITNTDWFTEEQALGKVLNQFYAANGEAAFAAANQLVTADLTWTTNNPRILRLLNTLGIRIVDISESTRVMVTRILADGMLEGLTLQELSNSIRTHIEATYKNRAEAIARTESQVAYNQSSALAYAESGEVTECELLDNPEHTDDYGALDGLSCAERHGLITPLEMVDTHAEAEHPNGSLIVVPILSTPLGGGE
jgi:HK97 family phage portal protein